MNCLDAFYSGSRDAAGRSFRSSERYVVAVVWVAASLGRIGAALSEDRVVITSHSGTSRIAVRGSILDYTGKEIHISVRSGADVKVYESSRVVEIESPQAIEHRHGLELFAQGRIDDAVAALELALKVEPRTWMRREILAVLVECELRRGAFAGAAARFLLLVKSDPITRHFEKIPLCWYAQDSHRLFRNEARSWLHDSEESARIIGASVLLDDVEDGPSAQATLKELAASSDERLRWLARAQLWRMELRSGELPAFELERWEARIDEMPSELRGGPLFLLGLGYLQRREYDRAAESLLWLPMVYHSDYELAAHACAEAADALTRVGRTTEARLLYQEVNTRFKDSPSAARAGEVLDRLSDLRSPDAEQTDSVRNPSN